MRAAGLPGWFPGTSVPSGPANYPLGPPRSDYRGSSPGEGGVPLRWVVIKPVLPRFAFSGRVPPLAASRSMTQGGFAWFFARVRRSKPGARVLQLLRRGRFTKIVGGTTPILPTCQPAPAKRVKSHDGWCPTASGWLETTAGFFFFFFFALYRGRGIHLFYFSGGGHQITPGECPTTLSPGRPGA